MPNPWIKDWLKLNYWRGMAILNNPLITTGCCVSSVYCETLLNFAINTNLHQKMIKIS